MPRDPNLPRLLPRNSGVGLSLLLAADDDEPDTDDFDGGLTEARRERANGAGISTEELRRELGLAYR